MRTFRLAKLVRDKIPEDTIAQGGKVVGKQLKGEELVKALINKLLEEAAELKPKELSASELSDIKEALDQLCAEAGVSIDELVAIQDKKRARIGGFSEGRYIDTVSLPDDNKWTQYYASDPKRFPEVEQKDQQ